MNKKIIISTLLIISLLLMTTLSFAADNTILQDGVNGIRNVVGGAENVVEDAAKGAAVAIKDGTANVENGLNSAVDNNSANDNNNNNNNDNNNSNHMVGTTDNNNGGNYTATRTATFMGMNGNTWTWFIIGIVGIAIIALVWSYSIEGNKARERNNH